MPFTFSHPSIILLLAYNRKKWFSLTGLVIGSVVPDFEYFLRMKVESFYSHKVIGLLWFDVPLGVLLAFIYHSIVRDYLFYNLPDFAKLRVIAFTQFNWNEYFKRNWPIVLLSILIGATTHIVWDAFTHERGYFVERMPALLKEVTIFNQPFPVCRIIQHTSTLLGAMAIAFVLSKLPKRETEPFQGQLRYWIIVAILALTAILIKTIAVNGIFSLPNFVATFISGVLIGLIITPLLKQKDGRIVVAVRKT